MKDNDTAVRRPILAVDRYTKATPLPIHDETASDEASDAFQVARAKRREATMLDVRLADGKIVTFPYHLLRKAIYQPEGVIVLKFGRDEVIAEGKNLHLLRDAITEHRARFIQEGTDAELGLKADDAPHIDSIVINEGEEDL